MRVCFGEFVLDIEARELSKDGAEISLEPKVFDCLALLVSRAGKVTSRAQLRARLWPDVNVADGALRRVINEVRRALGDSGSAQSQIRTRKGVGYVFVARLTEVVPSPATSPAADAARGWPFVGRTDELERLRAWLASERGGGLCLLGGEAGAGKSSLLASLRASEEARRQRARWLGYACPAALGLPRYWPFRQIAAQLMQLPHFRARLPPQVRQGRHALCALPELGGPGDLDPPDLQGHFELCEAFGALLADLAETTPLRLVIEDLHCADAGSIAMLDAIARAARGRPLHVFASYRPESVEPGRALGQFIGRTSGRQGTLCERLQALELEDIRTLLWTLQQPGWAGAAPRVLQHMTGGNALFVSEWIRHALALHLPLDAALPPSVAHIVEQRLSVLPEPTQRLLGQAAVLGHGFSLDVLAELAGHARVDALLAELEPARRAGVLVPEAGHADRFRFSHALVGDALVELLSLQERTSHHSEALRAWRSLFGAAAPSGVVAGHAFEAGARIEQSERRALCELAGREAFAAQAYDQAVVQLGRAKQLLAPGDRSKQAAELALLWARARFFADHAEHEIADAFLQAAEFARRADEPELLAQAAIGYAFGDESSVHLRSIALRPEALELLEEAWRRLVRAAGGSHTPSGEVPYRLAAALCWMRCEAGPREDFQRAARLALRLAPPAPGPFSRLWLLALRGIVEEDAADEVHAATLALLEGDELTLVQRIDAWMLMMGSRLSLGDLAGYERAVREVANLVALLPEPARIGRHSARLSAYVAVPKCAQGTLATMRGRFAEAEQALAEVGLHFARVGLAITPEQADHMFCQLLWLYGYQGRAAVLEPLIVRHLDRNPDARWFCALARTQFALERGDLEQAGEHFAVLRESRFRPHLRGKPLLAKPETLVRAADACVEVGELDDAAILYSALLPRASQCVQDGALICLGSCSRALAELAEMLGEHEEAERHFRTALAHNARLGHEPELVRARLGWGRALLARGRGAEARTQIATACATAQALGMSRALAQIEQLSASAERCA